jgi:predicted dehydrogenase
MRVVLIETGHWHAPLYFDALAAAGVEVIAASDSDGRTLDGLAARFGCRTYDAWPRLLDEERPDFAFAFGRHAEMAAIGGALVAQGVPFALEKPCGMTPHEVGRLRQAAEAAGVYAAVPYIFRQSDLIKGLGGSAPVAHLGFRMIAGAPDRYLANGCAWMLDPAESGGGCAMNLAGHFIDLVRWLTGAEIATVAAVTSNRLHGLAIEDYACFTLVCADGAIAVVETGYGYPNDPVDQRELSFTVSTTDAYHRSGEGVVLTRGRDAAPTTLRRQVPFETDGFYAGFVTRALAECRGGARTLPGLAEADAVMRVLAAAYASAAAGGQPMVISQP